MMSLFDYLGRAAGPELGREVAQAAAKAGVKSEMREVANPKYSGSVMLYPKAFLDLYFRNGLKVLVLGYTVISFWDNYVNKVKQK